MFCPKCGTESLPDHKFCKSCGAVLGAARAAQAANAGAAAPPPAAQAVPPQPPPGMTPVLYQAYPGGPQQVYYVPTSQVHPHAQKNVLEGLQSRIRNLASTDKLEGFSLGDMFSQVFKRHGSDAVEDYIMAGSSKTTPPLELVETGWPKPWMFFRLLVTFVIAYVGLAFMYNETGNPNCVPGIMLLGAFAIPLATLTLFFELNTPRNVSVVAVGKLFLLGGVVSLGVALLGYALPIFQLATAEAGIVEEVAKLAAVVLVMRSVRYKYELNGILFGATVGAGFACFETMGYALNQALLPGLMQGIMQGAGGAAGDGSVSTQAMNVGVSAMLQILLLRGIESPLGHVAWTAISAGAFWRVKQDRPLSPGMFLDGRFLRAFLIPVVMHATWDAPDQLQLPFSGNQILTGIVTWYVVFGLVQQGLKQVKEEQKAHLQSTLATVQAGVLPASAAPVLQAPGPVAVA